MDFILSPDAIKLFNVSIIGNPAPTFVSNKKEELYCCARFFKFL